MKKVLRIVWSREILKNDLIFKESAKLLWEIDIDFLNYFDLYYENWFKFINNWESIKNYDLYWVWWGTNWLTKWSSMIKWLIYSLWILNKKNIIDKQKVHNLCNDKFTQILFCEHYWFSVPKSIFFLIDEIYYDKYLNILEKKFEYPFIAKLPNVDRGDWVFLINSKEELLKLFINFKWDWILFQEKIENNWDYRIITIWDKVIGWIKRYNPNDYRNNVWKWWITEAINVSEKIENIAIDVTKKFNLSISGIDFFILDNWDYYIIEINDLPQYSWFEKTTWISYSTEVLKYFKDIIL
jgi:glutathione synthase/RimK-type ligase-like ATP-grasp enzyme